MALIIVDDLEEIKENEGSGTGRLRILENAAQIQHEYCRLLEESPRLGGKGLFEDPNVINYLKGVGVTYKGDYILSCEEWAPEEEFATWLNFPLQFSCLALYLHGQTQDLKLVLTDPVGLDEKYSAPMLKEIDVFLLIRDYSVLGLSWLSDLKKTGAEIRIHGISSKNMEDRDFFGVTMNMESGYSVFSKRLDKEVFGKIQGKLLKPCQTTLEEYLDAFWEKYGCALQEEPKKDPEKNREEASEYGEVMVNVNEKLKSFSSCDYTPVHWLFFMDGEWKYMDGSIGALFCPEQLLKAAALDPRPWDPDTQEYVDVSRAEKVFVMVLSDHYGRCNARRYWEHIYCFLKYDKEKKILEICNRHSALAEFHELLQASGDLHSNAAKDSPGGQALKKLKKCNFT